MPATYPSSGLNTRMPEIDLSNIEITLSEEELRSVVDLLELLITWENSKTLKDETDDTRDEVRTDTF